MMPLPESGFNLLWHHAPFIMFVKKHLGFIYIHGCYKAKPGIGNLQDGCKHL
jgi:hypothetical protein